MWLIAEGRLSGMQREFTLAGDDVSRFWDSLEEANRVADLKTDCP